MHISVSNFATIFNKIQGLTTSSTEHFLGPSRKNFLFFIFLQECFWAASLKITYEIFGENFTKKNNRSGFLAKNTKIKNNRLNQSSDVGDVADLKSAML